MIKPSFFIEELKKNNVNFFSGVPDSLLKSMCAYITDTTDRQHNIIAANEGNAVALATGYYLATGEIPVVYMQNSGLGNIVNPILSLADKEVYSIPMLLIIGWRGEPNIKDEPQHIKQGRVTLELLETLGVKYDVLESDEDGVMNQIKKAIHYMRENSEPYALVVKKNTFDSHTLINKPQNEFKLSREQAIKEVVISLPQDSAVVSTTGKISRELFEIRENLGESHCKDFLTVGSMGHANQIALGIALQNKERKIYCFDGDGAVLMHTGSMSIIGDLSPENFIHIVFNNGAHESVGGQPTVAFHSNMAKLAEAFQYKYVFSVDKVDELQSVLKATNSLCGPIFIEVKVALGSRKDLGRPTTSPHFNKKQLMSFLKADGHEQ